MDEEALAGAGQWIDYAGPAGHVPRYTFSDVGQGEVDPETFRDKIVVVGATAPVLQDIHPVSWPDDRMPGPEVHANAIATLLDGVPLRSTPEGVDLVLALVMAVLGPLAALLRRAWLALLIMVAAGIVYVVAAQLLFGAGLIVPVLAPIVTLAVGLVGTLLVFWLSATFERARTRDVFARFVPDTVVDQVLTRATEEGDPRLGGERMDATVMFSDLRGFTSFAEARPPEQVIEILNRYLTAMSDAILDHGGTLVAYMGDGIMAVFGAPVAAEDHPDRALAAARAMLERLEEFNAWMREGGLGDGFKMGIGLHSGPVMSGNVGSARRLEYAAIGDTTNTAARLEAMTKGTPFQLYVADSTRERLDRAARRARARGRARRPRARARDQRLGPARLRTASTPRAVASQVNGAARARPASRRRSRRASSPRSAVSAAAKASPSGGTRTAAPPHVSGSAVASAATTGVPQAIASSTGSPKPS